MDNLNIQMYKDGNDLIVVFKGVDKSIEDMVKSVLSDVMVKSVPALNNPVAETLEKPDVSNCEEILPEFLTEDYNNTTEETSNDFEEIVVEDEPKEEDPTVINNLVEYITLYAKIKQGLVKDAKACIDLLKNFKKLNENEFGKTMGSTLDKDNLSIILTEFNKIAPDAVLEKTKNVPIDKYLAKVSVSSLRYAIRGLVWYNMEL